VVDFKGKGGPRDDANWVRISSGESVITAEGTRNNRQLLEAINSGAKLQFMNPALAFTMPAFASPNSSAQLFASRYDLKTVETKLDGVINAIEDNRMKQNIYFNEHGVGIMTERAVRKTKQRWM
jgi:siroheme synthase (precorrin-2 oxidase/ferrochelatase)